MAVLVDPPQRDSADERSARPEGGMITAPRPPAPVSGSPAPVPKLAEPPIPGGRVEAMMGALIRVLAHSPLARPLPAVTLSALGLGGVAFVGLCATAPRPLTVRLGRTSPPSALAPRSRSGGTGSTARAATS